MAVSWPAREDLENHWHWRPEWVPERACLYWYLTFGEELGKALDAAGLEAVGRADWLDRVPAGWLHVTLCDVGFTDEVEARHLRKVVETCRPCAAEARCLHLRFGRAACMEDTIVLPVEPIEPLRGLQQSLRAATERALEPGPRPTSQLEFWPHLSLGYANRPVPAETAATVLRQIGQVAGEVRVDRLVLASVTRDRRCYRWTVLEELPLGRPAAPR